MDELVRTLCIGQLAPRQTHNLQSTIQKSSVPKSAGPNKLSGSSERNLLIKYAERRYALEACSLITTAFSTGKVLMVAWMLPAVMVSW